MTVQQQDFKIDPREYDIFAGLDVDKRRMTTTFTDHGTLSRSLSFPYSSQQLLNYVGKHFRGQKVAFVYEAGPTGLVVMQFERYNVERDRREQKSGGAKNGLTIFQTDLLPIEQSQGRESERW